MWSPVFFICFTIGLTLSQELSTSKPVNAPTIGATSNTNQQNPVPQTALTALTHQNQQTGTNVNVIPPTANLNQENYFSQAQFNPLAYQQGLSLSPLPGQFGNNQFLGNDFAAYQPGNFAALQPGSYLNTGAFGSFNPQIFGENIFQTPTTQNAVPAPTIKEVRVPQPYPVYVNKPVPVQVAIRIPVEVPKPYPIHVPHPVPVPFHVRVPVPVEKPYPVQITRTVAVPVEKPVYIRVPEIVPEPLGQQFQFPGFAPQQLNGFVDPGQSAYPQEVQIAPRLQTAAQQPQNLQNGQSTGTTGSLVQNQAGLGTPRLLGVSQGVASGAVNNNNGPQLLSGEENNGRSAAFDSPELKTLQSNNIK